MSDAPKAPDQNLGSSSNAAKPYMTDAVIAGGTNAARDQSAIDQDLSDENGDPMTPERDMGKERQGRI